MRTLTKRKADRSFVRDLLTDPFDAAIIKGMLDIGRGLALHVIAEGIEPPAQEAALLAMVCRLAQAPATPGLWAGRLRELRRGGSTAHWRHEVGWGTDGVPT